MSTYQGSIMRLAKDRAQGAPLLPPELGHVLDRVAGIAPHQRDALSIHLEQALNQTVAL